jgi:hypothetical protein
MSVTCHFALLAIEYRYGARPFTGCIANWSSSEQSNTCSRPAQPWREAPIPGEIEKHCIPFHFASFVSAPSF